MLIVFNYRTKVEFTLTVDVNIFSINNVRLLSMLMVTITVGCITLNHNLIEYFGKTCWLSGAMQKLKFNIL